MKYDHIDHYPLHKCLGSEETKNVNKQDKK